MGKIIGNVIIGKNRDDIIKSLKRVGEIVVLAKAEIIYAFRPDFFPNITTEQIMEEIKKQPEAYEYYRAGLIKIIDIEEVGEKSVESSKECICESHSVGLRSLIKTIDSKPLNCENKEFYFNPNNVKDGSELNPPKQNCDKCELYGECDHQGAYKKDGKWCYEIDTEMLEYLHEAMEGKSTPYIPLKNVIGTGSVNDQSEFNREEKWEKKKD